MKRLQILLFVSLLAAGCIGSGDDGDKNTDSTRQSLVQPSDPDALSDVLVIPGATSSMGSLPAPSATADAPSLQVMADAVLPLEAGGQQAQIPLAFSGAQPYSECLLQVPGSQQFFRLSDNSGTSAGMLQVPVQVPSNVASGSFCFSICIGDSNGNYSNVVEQCFEVSNPFEDELGTAGQGGVDEPGPGVGGGTIPQECRDLIDTVAVPSVGACYDGCIDRVLECVVANDCVGLPTTCSNPYIDCITACAQQQQ